MVVRFAQTIRTVVYGTILVALSGTAAQDAQAGQQQVETPPAKTSSQLFQDGCAACHGPDGRGAPQTSVAFDVPLPDFSDCRFASREPDSDWLAVIHAGGPARGFDPMMPAFGDAWVEDEAQRALDHVRTFCDDDAWPRGELNLPRSLVTEKAYPEDEAVITTVLDAEGAGAVSNQVLYEKRFGARSQFEIAVPFEAVERDSGSWIGGVGDMSAGVKHALYHDYRRGSIFSVGAEVIFPTGNSDDGLGKGTAVVEPFAAYGHILPADSFVQLHGGLELPTDTQKSEQEVFWRVSVGKSFRQGAFGRAWSPMLEVLGTRELVAGEDAQWDLVPQVQVTLNTRQHIMANVGVRIPVTDMGRRDTQVLIYLLWDWFDGGFFEGW